MVKKKNDISWDIKKLTNNQRKFLQKVQHEYPFNLIDWTVADVLKRDSYNTNARFKINDTIKKWKEHKKKFD